MERLGSDQRTVKRGLPRNGWTDADQAMEGDVGGLQCDEGGARVMVTVIEW